MNGLLDTHTFIWWDGSPNRLPAAVRAVIDNEDNRLFLSAASIWEIQIKIQIGKLSFQRPLSEIIKRQQENNNLEILPITLPHIYALSDLPLLHRDPFDRLIIAQARTENRTVLSVEEMFRQYSVPVIG